MVVSGGQQKGLSLAYTCIHFPQIPLPSRLPVTLSRIPWGVQQVLVSLYILNIAVCTRPSQVPNYPFSPATITCSISHLLAADKDMHTSMPSCVTCSISFSIRISAWHNLSLDFKNTVIFLPSFTHCFLCVECNSMPHTRGEKT